MRNYTLLFFTILLSNVVVMNASALQASKQIAKFKITEPAKGQKSKPLYLWATYYHVHYAKAKKSRGVRLKSIRGRILGPSLSATDFCKAAMEGTVKVRRRNGKMIVYNYAGLGKRSQVNCGRVYSKISTRIKRALGRTRFRRASGDYGDGVRNYKLQPFRTIAVDRKRIPYGTVIYIPRAKGVRFTYKGKRYIHDGYFFAGDTGGAIKKRHIDVFLGNNTRNPFRFIKNRKHRRFKAYVVWNSKLRNKMRRLHTKNQ